MSGDSLRLYFRYLGISTRSQMQYKASFAIQTLGHFLVTGSEFLALVVLFQRFGQINGWALPQMALFYGLISVAFAASEGVARAFDIFPRLVKAGDFDRILLRPRPAAFQVLAQEFQLLRLGRLMQGLLVLIWAIAKLKIALSIGTILLLLLAIAGGVCLFSGLFVLQATLSFWTVEKLEMVNCTTYGGVEAAQFPLTIYRPWFRLFFTFIIPLATINYFPAQIILGIDDPLGSTRWIQWMSPVAGFLFLAICLRFWHFGVRHYTSTGS